MGNEAAIRAEGCWDIRGQDLRQYYASFTRRALPDGAIWRLALASSCLPDGHPGYMAWLTVVAGTERFAPELRAWAIGLGETVAKMKPRLRLRSREYVPSYEPRWGRQASLDGLAIALFGESSVPAVATRAEALDCDRAAYRRIRDFVAGALLLALEQYESALRWAHRITLSGSADI